MFEEWLYVFTVVKNLNLKKYFPSFRRHEV